MDIIHGDCLDVMKSMDADSVNLIVTSPPYAMARKRTYGGIEPDRYVEWWMPRAGQMRRVLRTDGSLVVNIKEGTTGGERQTYVMEMIMEMRRHGWLWKEEYVWNKTNAMPGKWPDRFRDAWERCIHFSRSHAPAMYQDAVKVPVKESTSARYGKISEEEKGRRYRSTGSRHSTDWNQFEGRTDAYPTNVLTGALVCHTKGHPAAYPDWLPEFFIRLFTVRGDTVLDPFAGSGTTLRAAERLGRRAVGIDVMEGYVEAMRRGGRPVGQEALA